MCDLGGFLGGKLASPGLFILLDRIAPLFDQRLQCLHHLFVGQLAALFDLAVHQIGLDHSQRREFVGVLRLHRGGQIGNYCVF